jgi:hypothetical protein
MSPRAVDKRARPGNLGSSTTPEPPAGLTHLDEANSRFTPPTGQPFARSAPQHEGGVAEFVPEVVVVEGGIVGVLDDVGTDD